jgi:hypothetical protein
VLNDEAAAVRCGGFNSRAHYNCIGARGLVSAALGADGGQSRVVPDSQTTSREA